jgi:hypothetical protein
MPTMLIDIRLVVAEIGGSRINAIGRRQRRTLAPEEPVL